MPENEFSLMSPQSPQPTFNLGLATINRVNERFVEYAKAYAAQEWPMAFTQLDLVYQEIFPFMKSEEIEAAEKYYDMLIKEINDIDSTMQQASNRRITIQSPLTKLIREWSFLLRRYAHKHKIYMPISDDPRFAGMRK